MGEVGEGVMNVGEVDEGMMNVGRVGVWVW